MTRRDEDRTARRWLPTLALRLSGLSRLARQRRQLLAELGDAPGPDAFLRACLRWLELRADLLTGELERTPREGPLVVVANHPTGAMEGVLLLALLRSVRADVRVLVNRELLAGVPELRDVVIPFDLDEPRANFAPARAALAWVRGGGCLLAFPAAEVAARRWPWGTVREPSWRAGVAALQRAADATVLPVHVAASTSVWFHVAGMMQPRLRTLLLPRVLLAQRGAGVAVRVGHPVPAPQLARFHDDRERVDYLRLRSEILSRRVARPADRPPLVTRPGVEIAPPVAPWLLAQDVDRLPPSAELLRSGRLRVLIARAAQLPSVLPEIGRLRELTFRGVGEGSGRARDLDRHDADYEHLFVWDEDARVVLGAYRVGDVGRLLRHSGPDALYTSQLYRYRKPFLAHVQEGLELGRSFVQPHYQKAYLPLFLLWRGIGALVARRPQHRLLFGTVSISADHHLTSVHLMVDHLRAHCFDAQLGPHVDARRPWRPTRRQRRQRSWQGLHIAELCDVAAMVKELEVRGQGVPVLLEQYLKLGARVVGINVDPSFRTIDALVVVDMLRAPPHLQERYLGVEGMERLHAHHGLRRAGSRSP